MSAPLLLASASPQRRAILAQLGVPFEAIAAGVEEAEGGPPLDLAVENAFRKASAVAAEHPGRRVLGCDTVVALGPRTYGKPADEPEARATLTALAGRRHLVVSGLCVIEPAGEVRTGLATTEVTFRRLEAGLLDWYLASGEWRERAGGYAIQGRGAALVDGVEGDVFNVIGLPVPALLDLVPDLLAVGR